jgi:radical SAM protein with 4Fe4S-binding SPASM domain
MEQQAAFLERIAPICDDANIGATSFDWLDINAVRLKPEEVETLKRLMKHDVLKRVHPECPEVFDKLSINWDGQVSACCADSNNQMVVGDVLKQPLRDIWHADSLNTYRHMLADMRHDELPLCKNCWDTHSLFAPPEETP